QDDLLLADRADDLGVLARRVVFEGSGLVLGLPFQLRGLVVGVIDHDLGPAPGLVDHAVSLHPRVGKQLFGFAAGLGQDSVRLGLGIAGQPVSDLLGHPQHLGGLGVVVVG